MEKKWKSSNGNRNFVHHRILSAVTRAEFVSDRCNIQFWKVASAKTYFRMCMYPVWGENWEFLWGTRAGFQLFSSVPYDKFCYEIFNEKLGREDILKLTIGNDRLHQNGNDNGVRLVNFATSRNLLVKSTTFPHRNLHKHTWNSPSGNTHNQLQHILIGGGIWKYAIHYLSGKLTAILNTICWLQKLCNDWQ
jgi:hypothetical protein